MLALLVGLCAGLVLVLRSMRDAPALPAAPMTDDERQHVEDPAVWYQRHSTDGGG